MPIKILPKDEQTQSESKWISKKKEPKSWITKKETPKSWITKKETPKSWITKKETPKSWITKKEKPKAWITKKPKWITKKIKPEIKDSPKPNKDMLKAAKEAVKKSRTKRALDRMKNSKSGSSTSDIFKSYGKYDGKPIELKKGGRAGYALGALVKGAVKGAKKVIGQLKKDKGIVYAGAGVGGWELGKKTSKKKKVSKEDAYNERVKAGRHPPARKKRVRQLGGGRTRLLEELGRVEGEHSNRNRRAEVSRIHGELNKGYKKGGRAAFKHGKWVKATGVPHADIDKYVDKQTGKEIDDKPGSRFRKEGSTLEMGKKRGGRRAGQLRRNPGKKFKVVILKSLGGRVGAATHGFNKKILRTD